MIKIKKRTYKIGEYDFILFSRYFKDFKIPLNFSWLLPEEPLIMVKRKNKLVYIKKNKKVEFNVDEKTAMNLIKKVKHVNELIRINDNVSSELKVESYDMEYVFDENGVAIENYKVNINFMLNDVMSLNESKLQALDFSKKTMKLTPISELIKRDDIVAVKELRPHMFKDDCYYLSTLYMVKDKGFDDKCFKVLLDRHNERIDKATSCMEMTILDGETHYIVNKNHRSTFTNSVYFSQHNLYKGELILREIPSFIINHQKIDKDNLSISPRRFRLIIDKKEISLFKGRDHIACDFMFFINKGIVKFD